MHSMYIVYSSLRKAVAEMVRKGEQKEGGWVLERLWVWMWGRHL